VPAKDFSSTPLSRKLGAKAGAAVTVLFVTRLDDDWQALRFVYRVADRPR